MITKNNKIFLIGVLIGSFLTISLPYLFSRVSYFQPNMIHDISPNFKDGKISAVIEIPAGSDQKWEVSKVTGELEWEIRDGKKRRINFIPYPFNYGMIPQTLLSKEGGGRPIGYCYIRAINSKR